MAKYNNKKIEFNGQIFDSKKELKRYQELLLLVKSGDISDLQCQVKYVLIPSQYERPYAVTKSGKGKCLERECSYIADFVYKVPLIEGGVHCCTVVEDTKGFRTKDYIIKRKLMLFINKIRVIEV